MYLQPTWHGYPITIESVNYTVIVGQLAEQLLVTLVDQGSDPVMVTIVKNFVNCWKEEIKKRKRGRECFIY